MLVLNPARPSILADPKSLWEVRGPSYSERPDDQAGRAATITGAKTASDNLRSMAIGWRPRSKNQYRDLELSATIMGGIRALSAAGVYPWTYVKTDQFPELYFVKRQKRELVLRQLTQLAATGAKKAGDSPPTSPFLAAEYIRKKVYDADMQKPAWALRGLILTEEAGGNQAARGKAEATGGAAAMQAADAVMPFIPVGPIIATVLKIGGGIALAASVRSKTEAARSEGQSLLFRQMYEQGLEERVAGYQLEEAKRELDASQKAVDAAWSQKELSNEQLGERVAQAVVVGSSVLVIGAFSLVVVWSYRWLRRDK